MSLASDRTQLTSPAGFKALGRALYRRGYSGVRVSPVSKGTWSVDATVAGRSYRSRAKTKRWTGLDSLLAVEDALDEALLWVAAHELDTLR